MFDLGYEEEQPTREEIDALEGDALLIFGTNWCGYCRAAAKPLDAVLAKAGDLRVIKAEDGKGRRLGRSFGVKLWPTMIALKDGEEVDRVVRPNRPAQIEGLIGALHTEPQS